MLFVDVSGKTENPLIVTRSRSRHSKTPRI